MFFECIEWRRGTGRLALLLSAVICAQTGLAQAADEGPDMDSPPPPFGAGEGPGDFMAGNPPPGGGREQTKLVSQFDKDKDGRLNTAERQAARAYLSKQGNQRRSFGPGGQPGGFPGAGISQTAPGPGRKLTPAEVVSYPDAPLYASNVLRTFFLEFENTDWEKELAAFKGTDVEVPAKLTVDGKTYSEVGVHFHGNTSYFMVGEGRKRSLHLSLDFVREDQRLDGYRTLNLLNSHEDPTFLRTVLYFQIARAYFPAPKANLARVVINGECWGVYVNSQQFNKDFTKEGFGDKKGARWKVPGSPNGQGGLQYLGEDAEAYKRVYEIKTKDEAKPWADLARLCKVLNETPAERLEQALAALLDIDGTLKFLALDNALINNDGFWTRASDYDLYEDEKGRFHLIPYDVNETFSAPGGPGGPGMRGGPGGFGPGMILARQLFSEADKNGDRNLTQEELASLADAWFAKLDPKEQTKTSQEQFVERINDILPLPQGRGGFGPRPGNGPQANRQAQGARAPFAPARFAGQMLFSNLDTSKDGTLTKAELKATFAKWTEKWSKTKKGSLTEEELRNGLNEALPGPGLAGPQMGQRVNGVELDPLIAANDANKALLSKLLAAPSLRTRYLESVRDIAQNWLDWKRLGPLVAQYRTLIAEEVKADTRKLSTWEEFEKGVSEAEPALGGADREMSLRAFAERRRAYLLKHPEIVKVAQTAEGAKPTAR